MDMDAIERSPDSVNSSNSSGRVSNLSTRTGTPFQVTRPCRGTSVGHAVPAAAVSAIPIPTQRVRFMNPPPSTNDNVGGRSRPVRIGTPAVGFYRRASQVQTTDLDRSSPPRLTRTTSVMPGTPDTINISDLNASAGDESFYTARSFCVMDRVPETPQADSDSDKNHGARRKSPK